MSQIFTFTKKRLDAFILSLLLPLLGMGCGVVSLFCDVCINKSFLITFVLFPLVAAALLALCIFSTMRRYHRGVLSVIVLLFFAVLFFGRKVFGCYIQLERYQNEDVAHHYTSVMEENELMPSLEEIGQPIAIEYCDTYTRAFVFCSDADYLICRYDAEEYARQKQQLDETYLFQHETLVSYGHPCKPTEEVDGYQFRVLSTQGEYDPHIDYPWYMTLIAYSDEAQEIVYLSYCNTDLDYLTSLSDFLYEECGWQHVR